MNRALDFCFLLERRFITMGQLLSDLHSDAEAAAHETTRFRRGAQPKTGDRGLRMLCLHGRGSNNDITRMQVDNLLFETVHGVACDMLCATEETSPQNEMMPHFTDEPFYSWFSIYWLNHGCMGIGSEGGSLHTSLLRIVKVIEAHGPYDGVYGFSQGATLAAMLCNRTVWHGLFHLDECPFRFAILSNGALGESWMRACEIAGAGALEFPIEVPSLHLIGETDWVRPQSESLAKLFNNRMTHLNAVGHEIPARLKMARHLHTVVLQAFFQRFTSQREEEVGPRRVVGLGRYDEWENANAPPLWN